MVFVESFDVIDVSADVPGWTEENAEANFGEVGKFFGEEFTLYHCGELEFFFKASDFAVQSALASSRHEEVALELSYDVLSAGERVEAEGESGERFGSGADDDFVVHESVGDFGVMFSEDECGYGEFGESIEEGEELSVEIGTFNGDHAGAGFAVLGPAIFHERLDGGDELAMGPFVFFLFVGRFIFFDRDWPKFDKFTDEGGIVVAVLSESEECNRKMRHTRRSRFAGRSC